jgi:hypothetical protein
VSSNLAGCATVFNDLDELANWRFLTGSTARVKPGQFAPHLARPRQRRAVDDAGSTGSGPVPNQTLSPHGSIRPGRGPPDPRAPPAAPVPSPLHRPAGRRCSVLALAAAMAQLPVHRSPASAPEGATAHLSIAIYEDFPHLLAQPAIGEAVARRHNLAQHRLQSRMLRQAAAVHLGGAFGIFGGGSRRSLTLGAKKNQ